ncbi:MHYT domain-containing protein [Rhodococcus sp. B50]|uniref:MHYT domain-containing protein n=1 Tax=Rhodococcus sp. B50 TaxID=2682847 RepID=UPI001BD1D06B|nr:MHYT domain-containing protein [Rhodococcus sp. B50]MBS9374545.1 putative signaling protein [Rhodococcus sp. B50]
MSHDVHHFSMGLWVFFLSYATAVMGSFVGLSCVRRSLEEPRRSGNWWLVMASLSIGGVGIWLMHFIGMMGFSVPGTAIRYELAPTVFSVVLAVIATLVGLRIADVHAVSTRRVPESVRLLVGGLLMGAAVSLMHYSGMFAIRIRGTIEHEIGFVVASVIIGVVASTVALALARRARRLEIRLVAAFVMGCAVTALHYTGMAGVRVTLDPSMPAPEGMTVMSLLFPAFVLGIIVLAVPITALLLASDPEDAVRDARLEQWASEVERQVDRDPVTGSHM